ncbi:c-type cytochrome [Litorivita sp. NS0012-18]|uniref:c-type cytochrome n=1 Tax=Litorivita sp. NS0012-18 TaxID=3127655 RepID=UPI0031087890
MSKYLKSLAAAALGVAATVSAAQAGPLGLGRAATPEEVAAWNIDVRPDGVGLPVGSGNVEDGEVLFADNCASCHGDFAEGRDNWPKLAGGVDTLDHEDPLKTVGSYWPYLSTTWDYVNRSMPFGNAQSLSADEVYAIVAYILYSNDMVEDDFVLSNETFLDVEMRNADGFIVDDRPQTEYAKWTGAPCMENCKTEVKITMEATVLDVTPEEEEGAAPVAEPAKSEPATPAPVQEAALDPELVADGEKVFKKCKACHQVGEGAQNKTGPILNDIAGQTIGSVEGYKYSKTFKGLAAEGAVWDDAALAAFLAKPKAFAPKTKMSFAGLKKESDIAAMIAYLKSLSQ